MNFAIEIRESRGIRTLHFGSDWVQGAMRVNRPWDLELVYTREMLAALLMSPSWPEMPRRILQIGLGAGSLTKFIYRYLPEASQMVIERFATVIGAAQQAFQLPPVDDRLQIEVADGAAWLAATNQSFDLILVDGYDENGEVGTLESLDFYQQCRRHLIPGGVLSVNLLSSSKNFLESSLTLSSVFDGYTRLLPQTPGGNVIALASIPNREHLDEQALRERTHILFNTCNLDIASLVDRIVADDAGLPFSFKD